jgi:hypothetical protein
MDKERFAILIAPFGLSTKRLSSDARRLSKFPGPAQNRLNHHNRVPGDLQAGGGGRLGDGREAGGRQSCADRAPSKKARSELDPSGLQSFLMWGGCRLYQRYSAPIEKP